MCITAYQYMCGHLDIAVPVPCTCTLHINAKPTLGTCTQIIKQLTLPDPTRSRTFCGDCIKIADMNLSSAAKAFKIAYAQELLQKERERIGREYKKTTAWFIQVSRGLAEEDKKLLWGLALELNLEDELVRGEDGRWEWEVRRR